MKTLKSMKDKIAKIPGIVKAATLMVPLALAVNNSIDAQKNSTYVKIGAEVIGEYHSFSLSKTPHEFSAFPVHPDDRYGSDTLSVLDSKIFNRPGYIMPTLGIGHMIGNKMNVELDMGYAICFPKLKAEDAGENMDDKQYINRVNYAGNYPQANRVYGTAFKCYGNMGYAARSITDVILRAKAGYYSAGVKDKDEEKNGMFIELQSTLAPVTIRRFYDRYNEFEKYDAKYAGRLMTNQLNIGAYFSATDGAGMIKIYAGVGQSRFIFPNDLGRKMSIDGRNYLTLGAIVELGSPRTTE